MLITLTNQKRFQSEVFDDDFIVNESHLAWNAIYSDQRKTLVNQIKVQEILRQDLTLLHAGELTKQKDYAFKTSLVGERPYENNDTGHYAIEYEMNRNLFVYEREVYTSFDWFGNMGGLFEGMNLFFGFFVAILNYNNYENYMVSKLF